MSPTRSRWHWLAARKHPNDGHAHAHQAVAGHHPRRNHDQKALRPRGPPAANSQGQDPTGRHRDGVIGRNYKGQPNGGGTYGTFPPLAGSEWVLGDPERIAAVVLNGLGGEVVVAGETYNNQMTPVGETWTDEQVAAVLTFIRKEWGNNAGRVLPEAVAQTRAKTKESGHTGPWTEKTLNAAFPAE